MQNPDLLIIYKSKGHKGNNFFQEEITIYSSKTLRNGGDVESRIRPRDGRCGRIDLYSIKQTSFRRIIFRHN